MLCSRSCTRNGPVHTALGQLGNTLNRLALPRPTSKSCNAAGWMCEHSVTVLVEVLICWERLTAAFQITEWPAMTTIRCIRRHAAEATKAYTSQRTPAFATAAIHAPSSSSRIPCTSLWRPSIWRIRYPAKCHDVLSLLYSRGVQIQYNPPQGGGFDTWSWRDSGGLTLP